MNDIKDKKFEILFSMFSIICQPYESCRKISILSYNKNNNKKKTVEKTERLKNMNTKGSD